MADETDDSSPTPSEALKVFLDWLRGFHLDRERSKAADWAMVVLTLATAAFLLLQLREGQKATQAALDQVKEAQRNTDAVIHNFEIDERAWIELEPIPPATVEELYGAESFSTDVRLKNVGKTIATRALLNAAIFCRKSSLDLTAITYIQDNLNKFPVFSNTCREMSDPLATIQEEDKSKPQESIGNNHENVMAPNSEMSQSVLIPLKKRDEPNTFLFFVPNGDPYVLFLLGRFDYYDEFGVPHWLRFCYEIHSREKHPLTICAYGNNADNNSEVVPNRTARTRAQEVPPSRPTEGKATNRASGHTLLWGIFGTLIAGVLTSLMASFFYARFTSRIRDQRLREQFSKLAGEYQETERNTQGFPVATGGIVTLTYCGGTKFKTKGVTLNGELLWEGELFMSEEAGVLGRGFYSHATRDDTGIHQVVHNPVSGHFNVSGENTSHANGRKFKMAWMPLR